MSDEIDAPAVSTTQPAEQSPARPDEANTESKTDIAKNGSGTEDRAKADGSVIEEEKTPGSDAAAADAESPQQNQQTETKATTSDDGEMNGDNATNASADAASAEGNADTSAKSKSRRKSGVPEHRGKKLNRKASQAKILHLDAKPGDYYMVKLKGYPTWPAIICDEDMLPQALLSSRPQTAARMDGTYRPEYADGGKRVRERTYPVMFMATNEFAWTVNTDLREFDVEESSNFPPNRTKNLNLAHQLAVEQHPLSHWKEVLDEFQESLHQAALEEQARLHAKEEKEKKKAAKKATKTVEEGDVADDEDDITMDVGADSEPKKKKQKKRELTEGETKSETPAAKKIKLNMSSKSANGTPASSAKPKSEKKESAPKPKKASKQKEAAEVVAPKIAEPELSPEEQRAKKEREILFLRHKLQKGLLSRESPPEESQMAQMAEYINKLEGYPDLEVSIIKATKINKVLKAILKLDAIPKEAEFNFKTRSSQLLSKWNYILDNAPKEGPASEAAAATNGLTNGDAKAEHSEKQDASIKEEVLKDTNGVKPESEAAKADDDVEMKEVGDVDTVMEDAGKREAADAATASAPEEAKDTAIPDAPTVDASA